MTIFIGFLLVIWHFFANPTDLVDCEVPWKMHTIDNSSLGSDGSKMADVNGNGLLDVVVGWEEGGVSRLYFNPGEVKDFWDYVEVPSPDVEDAFAMDLDGDGFMDLITFSEGKHQRITVHWAPADREEYRDSRKWISEDIPVTIGRSRWMFGRAMDIDGKNGIDLIVGSKDPRGTLGWLESPLDPRKMDQWKYHEISKAGWIMSIETVDMDGDGLLDILVSDRYGENRGVRWLKNPGSQPALIQNWENHVIGMDNGEPMFLTLLDLEGDGNRSIIVPDLTEGWVMFNKQNDHWASTKIPYPDFAGTRGKSVAVADINGDGNLDLLASFEGAKDRSGVIALMGFLSKSPSYCDISGLSGVKYDFLKLVDMDGDGDLDILTSEETGYDGGKSGLGVIWYENSFL